MEEDGDKGPDRKAVARMCIVTREVRPIADLIRFVAGPDGELVPDIKARLPGRGVWVTNDAVLLAYVAGNREIGRLSRLRIRRVPLEWLGHLQ